MNKKQNVDGKYWRMLHDDEISNVELQGGVNSVSREFEAPCIDLGDKGLWSDDENVDNKDLRYRNVENNKGWMHGTVKNLKEDMMYEASKFQEDLRIASGFKKNKGRSKGRRGVADMEPSEEVKCLLGYANQAFASGDFSEALKTLQEIIRIDSNVFAAWQTLGEVHRERGNIDKCLGAWISAAHLKPKDADLWLTCAKLSQDAQLWDQADYCYNRAIHARPADVDAIWDRAVLARDRGRTKKAIDCFKSLLGIVPNDMSVIRQLARLYFQTSQVSEGIALYEKAVEYYLCFPAPFKDKCGLNWNELHIMSELYIADKRWKQCVYNVKYIARWLRGRKSEDFWDNYSDDREWDNDDERRKTVLHSFSEDKTLYNMPMELRVKLGICRIHMGDIGEGLRHFEVLDSNHDLEKNTDLIFDAANALTEKKLYYEALRFYSRLIECDTVNGPELCFSMGKCYRAINDLEAAEECFKEISSNSEKHIESLVQLADIYQITGRREEALDVVNKVIRYQQNENSTVAEVQEESQNITPRSTFIIDTKIPKDRISKKISLKPSLNERIAIEMRRTEHILFKWQKLNIVRDKMLQGDPHAVNEWLDTAGDMVDEFRNVRGFYPSEKSTKFKGVISVAKRRMQKMEINQKLKVMANRLQESLEFSDDESYRENTVNNDVNEFRGLTFDTWFYIFMQYAICLTKHDDFLDALEVIKAAMSANVFYQSHERLNKMHVTRLACSFWSKQYSIVAEECRYFSNLYKFRSDGYRLYFVAMPTGEAMLHYSANSALQKYLLRQIKSIDSAMSEKNKDSLSINKNENDSYIPTHYNVVLLVSYGHVMICSRSYVQALNYYGRAYALAPLDPLISLSIGMAYLHRAMQRQSNNRQYQILQGMTFLFRYYELRKSMGVYEHQEAEFNIARAFHQLGLTHLAIPYYKRVLSLIVSDSFENVYFDLRRHAVYNLSLIYVTSGNLSYARNLVDTHFSI
ncbi:hypothetical protein PNEG_03302 [Pneumocystis murina B123]|uniref:Uncharacterized protein n=1 Tax=Pneumocystis murina (strain B123) TaxID=1069680 RepID=M7PDD9_PNEMU|nr:hypothetical protein PNEG_03302 [Pneumocystis murina B123]EMR08474.1 hypothetical protein PNEG_03302 [Pneumocystis murina B123]